MDMYFAAFSVSNGEEEFIAYAFVEGRTKKSAENKAIKLAKDDSTGKTLVRDQMYTLVNNHEKQMASLLSLKKITKGEEDILNKHIYI